MTYMKLSWRVRGVGAAGFWEDGRQGSQVPGKEKKGTKLLF